MVHRGNKDSLIRLTAYWLTNFLVKKVCVQSLSDSDAHWHRQSKEKVLAIDRMDPQFVI